MLPGGIPGAWHCRQRGESGMHSLLFPLDLHLSFLVSDLVLVLRLLVIWRGKLVWGWELWTKQVLTGSWTFAVEQPAVICLGLCVLCANDRARPPGFCRVTHFPVCGTATALGGLWHCWSLVLIYERITWMEDLAETVRKGFISRNRPRSRFLSARFPSHTHEV